MDFANKVLRSLSLGTGGKMALRSEEAVVGVSVGIKAIAGGSYPRWWWDGRTGDAAVCLDASKRLKRSTKGSSSTHPAKSRACLKACGHRLYIERRLVLYEITFRTRFCLFF